MADLGLSGGLPPSYGGGIGLEEAELHEMFNPERISELAAEFVSTETENGKDLITLAGERQFVVAYIPADSPFSDIPRSVETRVFSTWFKQSFGQVVADYGKYDSASEFVAVIDLGDNPEKPRAASALRIIDDSPLGFKDVNDLVKDPESPWREEIKDGYFDPGEQYDPEIAWQRLGERAAGSGLILADSQDIASHASEAGYAGQNGDLNGPSMLFYHACLRRALADGKSNLLAIFDQKPFENLQQFGNPFDTYPGLSFKAYGGPGPTMPAFCRLDEGMQRIRNKNEGVGKVFIDGFGLDQLSLLPNEYAPDRYSNEAVGLT